MTLSAIDRIAMNSAWLPHHLDFARRTVEFMRVPDGVFAEPGFLFEYNPSDPADRLMVSIDRLRDIECDSIPVHFIFHTAFCRSTILARALNIHGLAIGLSEPGIIGDLASAGQQARPLYSQILRLLARKRHDARAVFIKPTNHANRIIPDLMEAAPCARAVLMTNPLASFLHSVRRRGLMGHRWGRKLYLEMQGYSGIDLGLSAEELFAMSDLQTAGMAWLLYQNYFTRIASGPLGKRIRTLDGNFFNNHRGETIAAALSHCGVQSSGITTDKMGQHVAFASHSKLGGNFEEAAPDQSTEKEIEQVEQWIGMIADQMGLSIPVPQTLL